MALVAIMTLSADAVPAAAGSSADDRGPESDQAVQHEFDMARPEIVRLNQLLNAELVRALAGWTGAPSAAMQRVMEESSHSHLALGDTTVPLHRRLIERQRLEVIAGFKWLTATVGHCDENGFGPADLLDDRSRSRIKSVSRCHQSSLDRDQLDIHQLSAANEASVIELKLPPAFQKRMLREARRNMERQDAEIASTYAHRRAFWEATDDLVKFFDTHPAHLAANRIVMDDGSDGLAAEYLLARFIETSKQQ